jgi:hypothetical protein
MLPFGADVFSFVVAQYDLAIWPAQPIAFALGLAVLVAALRPFPGSCRLIGALLALAWLWTGIAFHGLHFTPINFWAYGFAALFVLQGLLLARAAARDRLQVRFAPTPAGWAGLALALFALSAVPLLGGLAGHGWPVVGVAPTPTTIFTWGLLLMSAGRALHLAIIPLIWSLIGAMLGTALGAIEELAMPVAAIVGLALLIGRKPK